MALKLIFKKAFGIQAMPMEHVFWCLELGKDTYKCTCSGKHGFINVGSFGINDQQKQVLSNFYHSDERMLSNISEIPTIDISLDVNMHISKTLEEKWKEGSIINDLVEPIIEDAFMILNHFFDAYRDIKYSTYRKSKEWEKKEIALVPRITENEFKTFLFYTLSMGKKTFVGCFSEGQSTVGGPFTADMKTMLQKSMNNSIPLYRRLIVRTWEYYFQEDFRSTVIYSATIIEIILAKIIRKSLMSRTYGTNSQIDKFINDTSNRLLSTVVLGMLGIGDKTLRNNLADIFEIRNGLVHGKKKNVSRADAKNALSYTEQSITLFENTYPESVEE